jgi:hypothetical protein
MNAYYQKTNRTIAVTNNRPLNITIGDKIISFICAVISFFTCSAAVAIEKAVFSTAGFVAFFGIIGSMESGAISMVVGILLCAAISLGEFLVLRSLVKKVSAGKKCNV